MNNLRLYGDAPYRIAVVHGGPGAPGSVAAIARELSTEHGVLEPLQTQHTVEGQVLELREVLQRHAATPVTLIGHSWGAWLAFLVAARFPALVGKLILVSSGPFEARYVADLAANRMGRLAPEERTEFQELLGRLNSAPDKDLLMRRLEALVAKSDNYEPLPVPTEERDLLPADGEQHQAVWAEAAQLRKSGALLEHARYITCPVMAIHGDCDPHPAIGVKQPLEQRIGDFRFILLEKCGHNPWKERHARDSFYRVVRSEVRPES
ncbi:MAG TPA: alpha/beta hydrolase [Symbiobacteriaceae bacterium]|nr:alpha/beta hydrolase [Symbiobacteriaceae bacterium]